MLNAEFFEKLSSRPCSARLHIFITLANGFHRFPIFLLFPL